MLPLATEWYILKRNTRAIRESQIINSEYGYSHKKWKLHGILMYIQIPYEIKGGVIEFNEN